MESKFAGKSKTLFGASLAFLSMVAPILGVDFTAGDADTLLNLFTGALDSIIGFLGVAIVVWGRFSAKQPIALLPGNSIDTYKSPWWVSAVAVFALLAGCVGGGTYPEDATPAEKLRASYDATLPLITVYLALPSCAPDVVGLCSKPDVASKLNDGSLLVAGYLEQIEATEGLDDAAKAKALKEAQNALRTLLTLYAVQALTKA